MTTQMDLDLWHLATAVRADDEAAEAVRRESAPRLADRYRAGMLPEVLQQGLRTLGWIRTERRRIVVLDLDALRRYAG